LDGRKLPARYPLREGVVVGLSQHYDLGVLFVHGIGDQQQNSTLSRFGGSLQRWLRRWYGVDTTEPAPAPSRSPPSPWSR